MPEDNDQEVRRILKLAQNICRPHGVTADEVVVEEGGYGILIRVPHNSGTGDSTWHQNIKVVRDELQKIAGVKSVFVEIDTPK